MTLNSKEVNFEELENLLLGEAETLQKEVERDLAASIFHGCDESLDET